MTFITTVLKQNMGRRENYSSPTPTLSHMKLREKIFTNISTTTLRNDTSDYSSNHPSGITTGVLGMFKDEAGGKQILEFVGFILLQNA